MKRDYFTTITLTVAVIIVLMLIGNIITIGDKLSLIHPIVGWLFYLLIVLFMIYFIIIPIIKVATAPRLTGNQRDMIQNSTPGEIDQYIRRAKFTEAQRYRLNICDNQKSELLKMIEEKQQEMKQEIKNYAVSIFVITTISQNGTIDMLSSIGQNFRMINKLVSISGYRPSFIQVAKLYATIFSSALLITSIDDILDDMDFEEFFGSIGVLLSNPITKSITNGSVNAFVALRVGYATLKYLDLGEVNYTKDKKSIKIKVRKDAKSDLLDIAKRGVVELHKKLSYVFDDKS